MPPPHERDLLALKKENDELRRKLASLEARLAHASADERVRESETRFRYLSDSAPIMIGMTDVQGNITYINKRWLDFTGSSDADNMGFKWLSLLHPDDSARVESEVTEAVQKQAPYAVQYRLRRTDGAYRWILDKAVPRYTDSGEYIGYVGVAMDITDWVEAREEKRKMEARIQHAQKLESLGLLAGGVAHDFNNLLTGILGNANLALKKLEPGSPIRENITLIERASLQAAEMTRQLLAFSGKGKFLVEAVNLSALTEETAKLLQLSVSKQATLTFRLVPDLPAIEADAAQIRQVLMNLVINASDALMEKQGTISVSTGLQECDSAYLGTAYVEQNLPVGQYVCLEVCDTGCGMDKETLSKIFDPFFTTKFTGRGIGLAATLGIVRGHKGTIKIYSEPGKGSSFKVLFPASERRVQERNSTDAVCEKWRGSGVALVVDDEEAVRSVAKEMLQRSGFTVIVTKDGEEALRVFGERANDVAVVLLDLTMPGMSGEEVFRRLRVMRPDVRVILSSGYNEQDTISRFTGKGVAGFLPKPFTYNELIEKIAGKVG